MVDIDVKFCNKILKFEMPDSEADHGHAQNYQII